MLAALSTFHGLRSLHIGKVDTGIAHLPEYAGFASNVEAQNSREVLIFIELVREQLPMLQCLRIANVTHTIYQNPSRSDAVAHKLDTMRI